MAQAGREINRQIELPFSEAVRISFQSLKIRFWRSMITTAGILLSIAFLVATMSGNEIDKVMIELEGRASVATVLDDDQSASGISPEKYWLMIMCSIVCVVGISNAMLMSVTERFREIGTMKCLGALDKFIVELFLLESGFQGLSGAILGSLIGFIGIMLLSLKNYGLDLFRGFTGYLLPVLIWMGIACVFGMMLAVLGALWPSWRAAKLPPAEAMRADV